MSRRKTARQRAIPRSQVRVLSHPPAVLLSEEVLRREYARLFGVSPQEVPFESDAGRGIRVALADWFPPAELALSLDAFSVRRGWIPLPEDHEDETRL